MISKKLAEVLGVNVGRNGACRSVAGKAAGRDVLVVDLLDDIAGLNAYMDIDAVNRLMREGPQMSVRDADDRPDDAAGHLPRAQGDAAAWPA